MRLAFINGLKSSTKKLLFGPKNGRTDSPEETRPLGVQNAI